TAIDVKSTKGGNVTKFKSDGMLQLQQYFQAMQAQPPSVRYVRYVFMPNGDSPLSVFIEALNNFGYLSADPDIMAGSLMNPTDSKITVHYMGRDGLVRQVDGSAFAAWKQLQPGNDQAAFLQRFEADHPGIPVPQFNQQ
ncbi:MAG TPA: hypothetical protein VKB76_04495, partial [Ktedonobacterales bacterium]|nr:hypothetical protein [Ktedonobacterales bacterium]